MSQRPRRTSVQRPERYRRDAPELPEQVAVADEPVDAIVADNPDSGHVVIEIVGNENDPAPTTPPLKWGSMQGNGVIQVAVDKAYEQIVSWRKNIFDIPRGAHGAAVIQELTRLLDLFSKDTAWKSLAMSLIHVFLPLMLQNPMPDQSQKRMCST